MRRETKDRYVTESLCRQTESRTSGFCQSELSVLFFLLLIRMPHWYNIATKTSSHHNLTDQRIPRGPVQLETHQFALVSLEI